METTTSTIKTKFLKYLQTAGNLELERALKNVTELIQFYENIADPVDIISLYGDEEYINLIKIQTAIFCYTKNPHYL